MFDNRKSLFCFFCCVLFLISLFDVRNAAMAQQDDDARFETLIDLANKTSKTEPKLAIKYAEEALAIGEKKHDQIMIARAQMMLASTNYDVQNFSTAIEFIFKALNIVRKNNQSYYMAFCFDLIGLLSKNMSEFRKAIEYFNLSRKIYLAEGNKKAIGQNYVNMAEIYEKLKQQDSVRLFYYRALDYYRESESVEGLSAAYTGLANYYQMERKLDSAQFFIGKSLKAALLSESTNELFNSYQMAGNISLQQGYYQMSQDYYHKALFMAHQNRNREQESTVKLGIGNNYAAIGYFDSAYHYLSQANAIEDSIHRYNEIQKRAYLFAEHSVKEQLEQEKEAEQMQQRLWWIIVCLCVAVMVILIIFIRLMTVRQKKIESIKAELNRYKSNLELILQDRTHELILSEQQIQNLSNNLPNGAIFRFSFENEYEGKMVFVSSGWEELTGHPVEASQDPVFFFQNKVHPDDSRELFKALAHAIRNRTLLDMVYRFYKDSEEMRWFHVRAIAITGANGLTYLDGYQVDETEQKHFEQELVAAKNKAEESDKLKSAFLANMSHEIRTFMNAIIGFSSMLSNTQLPNQRQVTYLELIQENCQRLLRLIDDIVDISKIEAGQLNLRMEKVQFSEVMIDVRDYFELVINAGYPHVELWIDESLFNLSLTVHTDVFRLKQIFVNLIENALKFTEKGFVRCGQLHDREDAVHFYVMDTGIGIAHENFENIFQSFRKLDQYSGGTGLGLSIVRRVLLLMGGSIWVESEPGVGSTFHFTLPLKDES